MSSSSTPTTTKTYKQNEASPTLTQIFPQLSKVPQNTAPPTELRNSKPSKKSIRSSIASISLCMLLVATGQVNVLLGISALFSIAAFHITNALIPTCATLLLNAGKCGRDMHRRSNNNQSPLIPESLGIAAGATYTMILLLFLPVPFYSSPRWPDFAAHKTIVDKILAFAQSSKLSKPSSAILQFAYEQLGAYTAALLSTVAMLLLGFVDDMLNLPWRYKILLPATASLPLLIIYAVTTGNQATSILIPTSITSLSTWTLVDIGVLYYGYMAALAIFCTHSINILAGINGIEVGQSIVIAASVAVHNLVTIMDTEQSTMLIHHQLSLTIILPFIACSLALLKHNWHPASIFVGDTYCYFAGMTLAVSAILGHFGKTMLFLVIPQIINFALSLPQLLHLLPCPRHRMPSMDDSHTLLVPSTFSIHHPSRMQRILMISLSLIGMVRLKRDPSASHQWTCTNLTILNTILIWTGPIKESSLAYIFLVMQALINLAILAVRHMALSSL